MVAMPSLSSICKEREKEAVLSSLSVLLLWEVFIFLRILTQTENQQLSRIAAPDLTAETSSFVDELPDPWLFHCEPAIVRLR